jgi:hypothetical protein
LITEAARRIEKLEARRAPPAATPGFRATAFFRRPRIAKSRTSVHSAKNRE